MTQLSPTEEAYYQARAALPRPWQLKSEEPIQLQVTIQGMVIRLEQQEGGLWHCANVPETVSASGHTVSDCLASFIYRLRAWMAAIDIGLPHQGLTDEPTPPARPAIEDRTAELITALAAEGVVLTEGQRKLLAFALIGVRDAAAAAQLWRDAEIARDYELMGLSHTWTHRLGKEIKDRLLNPQARPLAHLRQPLPPEQQAWLEALAARLNAMYPDR